jgi:DNA-binding MarR family transcriptional regulator
MAKRSDKTESGADDIELLYTAVRLTRPLLRHITASVDAGARKHGVTVGQRAVLEALFDGGAMPGPQLVAVLALKRQFVFRMLAETDQAELTVRTPNPDRARAFIHDLTDRGRSVLASIREAELNALAEFAATQAPADVAAWARVQARLNTFFAQSAIRQNADTQGD